MLSGPPSWSLAAARHFLRHVKNPGLLRQWGGPRAVQHNLQIGLNRAGIRYRINDFRGPARHIGVLRNVDALRWAIQQKQEGRAQTVVAGPNLVMLPTEAGGIVASPDIDWYVVPAAWTREQWTALCPAMRDRLVVWPVGVDEYWWRPMRRVAKTGDVLIYPKSYPPNLLVRIREEMERRGLRYTLLRYGAYGREEYRDLLLQHRWMLFLSESESQGIALFEAWACDVPTLVWDRRLWSYGGQRWPATSAPYLKPDVGATFFDESDLAAGIDYMQDATFAAREHVEAHYTAKVAAECYAALFGAAK